MWNREQRENEGTPISTVPRPSEPQPKPEPRTVVACIGPSVIIKGEVISAEDLIINGRVEGTIDLNGHSLAVGVGASIEAALVAKRITINGTVTGNVTASEAVVIREAGSVQGDVRAPRIALADGALVRGRIDTEQRRAAAQDEHHEQLAVAV